MLQRLILRALVSLLAALALAGCGEKRTEALKPNQPAPAFTLPRLDQGPLNFPSDLAGKPVVVRFWADWCPYCRKEMKLIEAVYQRHKGSGLTVLAVNVSQDPDTVRKFMDSLEVSYPALLDEKSEVARTYGVVALPTTVFVGRDGRVRQKILGEADEAAFEAAVKGLL